MVRLRGGRFDCPVQVGFLTGSGERRRTQEKAIRLTMGFLQKNSRGKAEKYTDPGTGPRLGSGDEGLNEQVEEPFVGEFHKSEQKVAEHEVENLLRNTDSTSITTMSLGSGPTYFSPQGTSRTLDHWVGPVEIHHIVEECGVLWQMVRRLQLIPAGLSRDHLPILLTLRYTPQPQRGETSTARPGIRWDLQAIADCLQKRDKRVEFPGASDGAFEKAKPRMEALREDPTLDALDSLGRLHEGNRKKVLQPPPHIQEKRRTKETVHPATQTGRTCNTQRTGSCGHFSEQHLHARHRLISLSGNCVDGRDNLQRLDEPLWKLICTER